MTVRTDNLFIAHYQGSLLEEFHYYPFGMCFDVSKSPTLGKSAAVKYNSQLHEHDEFEDANGNVYGLEDYNADTIAVIAKFHLTKQLLYRHLPSKVCGKTNYSRANFAFRNYDAQIGRWLQPDPLMQHPSPYLAMSNNPVSFTDPTGLWDFDENDGDYDFNFTNSNDSYKPKPKIKNIKNADPKKYSKIEKKRFTFGIYSGETFLNTFELPDNSSGTEVLNVHGKKRSVGSAYGEKAGRYISSAKNWAKGLKAGNDPYMKSHGEPVYTMNEFIQANKGLTRNEIINQRQDRSKTFLGSQAGGPNMRYVKNPHDGRVLDMRHMLVIGNYPVAVGHFLEGFQWITRQASGMDLQDFYSNGVGYQFYMQNSSLQILINPSAFTDQLNSFFNNPRVIYNR